VRAASLAAELRERIGVEAAVISGLKGQFDIVADDVLVFSKQREGRFPEPDEIVAALSAAA
jgi:selT/selW/selH-like putative selenoprotein